MCMYVCVCVYIYIYIYIYIHTHTHTHSFQYLYQKNDVRQFNYLNVLDSFDDVVEIELSDILNC